MSMFRKIVRKMGKSKAKRESLYARAKAGAKAKRGGSLAKRAKRAKLFSRNKY